MLPLATSHHLHSRNSLDVIVFEQWHLLFLTLILAVLYSHARKNDDGNSREPTAALFDVDLLRNLRASGDMQGGETLSEGFALSQEPASL
jgi:hypothetical protein